MVSKEGKYSGQKRGWDWRKIFLLLFCVFVVLFLSQTNVLSFTRKSNFIYYGRPLLWLGMAGLVFIFPRKSFAARPSIYPFLLRLAGGAAGFHLLLFMVAGLTQGFAKSPYAFTPYALFLNLFYVFSFTLGVEVTRSYLINSYKGKRVIFFLGLISLFFVFTGLSWREIRNIRTIFVAVEYIGGTWCPALAESVFASYFAYLGGFFPAMIYHGFLLAFEWVCPLLPDLGWPMKTFLGCFVPIFSLLFVQHLYLLRAREIKRTATNSEQLSGWLLTSIFSILLIWFAVGIFPLYPSVIVTGSMEPLIKPGDIVLVQKIKGEQVQIGDVIQYLHLDDNIYITHRVIAIGEKAKGELRTKGDNNPTIDSDPVLWGQVRGKVKTIIPKVGWLTLFLKSRGNLLPDVVI